ncbi:hypothetical protein BGZ80_004619 [Entomortierella chlamydospora]|uniref:Uncharacterized protein n=1 Tax=Entomortierella chlamydospora TaxID=101097 RepID=A0A9P6SVZ1_9FUNG|nr:hypothetical protein BGZ80_004619 [Entomortierella chlamydospora]
MSTPLSVDSQSPSNSYSSPSTATPSAALINQDSIQSNQPNNQSNQSNQPVLPADFVFQLILEQFWGDGVSKREIRSVYTTATDANAACHDYLLRTWSKDQFSLYEIGASPQRPELSKVSAIINGDRFHVWIERHPWKGSLDFSSKAIARRVGKGPNAYILQRTIKDASGGKRRSTTQGIFATRQLAKQALAHEPLPPEWPSTQGYLQEPGGEYAHALSPSGKTAWLFIEVRPLYMTYTPLDQELQDPSTQHLGTSVLNPISLDQMDDDNNNNNNDEPSSNPASPSTGLNPTFLYPRTSSDIPFSPMPSNPDEAGAYVYLVLQLKTIPYTPPILTVEAVAYEIEVANRFGTALLEEFTTPGAIFEPAFRDDGCLQGTVERHTRDEGLTVWVEKRAVILGDENIDFDLISEHGSVQLNRGLQNPPLATGSLEGGGLKRGEPEGGFEKTGRQDLLLSEDNAKVARLSSSGYNSPKEPIDLDARYRIMAVAQYNPDSALSQDELPTQTVVDSHNDIAVAVVSARVRFFTSLAQLDVSTVDIKDELDSMCKEVEGKKEGAIQARSRSDPSIVLLEVRIEDNQK